MVKSTAGGDKTGNRSGQPAGENQLDRDQYWIDLEAFATSSRGLGIPAEVFWGLSWREIEAHRTLWAKDRAEFYNSNYDTKGVPFLAEDFLGTGNRDGRTAAATISKMNADLANVQLQNTVNGNTEDGIPDWAKGNYHA